ncbi:hypothetical protein Mgra_00006130 [Meloidogyne graminicola]|uniref:Uncharacterized protein n=1 Tax=Meloidogyne graminicola TaxID=189291 RepID=A0A8S9ZMB4_9BILA|nr:hypothetical protein Mgra_00006130 [Meloidogyne graminicola]
MENQHYYFYNNNNNHQQQHYNNLWCLPKENEQQQLQQHSSSLLSPSFPSSHNYYYSSFPGCSTPMASPVQRMEATTSEIAPLHTSLIQSDENAFTPVPIMDELVNRKGSSGFLNNFSDQPQNTSMENIPWSSPNPQNQQQIFPTYSVLQPSIQANFEEFQLGENDYSQTSSQTSQINQQPTNQYSQQEQQQRKLREQRRCLTSQNRVQQWQQFGQMPLLQDSGVHSMSHSTAPSVMSSIHPASCMSAVSSLPDEFPGLNEHPYFQNIPNSIRHEEPEKMRQVLPELIPLINDESEEIVLRALTILISIARKDKELCLLRSQFDAPLISERRVVEELLRTLHTHKKNKKIAFYVLKALHFISDNEPSGRGLFVSTLNAHGTDCLVGLVHFIDIQEHSCFKIAFLILHNLMTDLCIGRKVIAYMCEMKILAKVLNWLSDKNEKFLNVVTDIVHMLVNKNSEQMAFLLTLNGHQKLIYILANSQHETLLYRAVKLLNKVVHLDPNKIVEAGLLEAAQKHLDQASHRLICQLVDCIRAISHVPCGDRKINILLQKLLQLMGTSDPLLKESCTDILANLSANNANNKAFLVENGAVYGLFQLLHQLDALNEALGESVHRQNVQERALSLLRSLSSGNDFSGKARQQIITKDFHKQILLERLRNKQRNWPLLRRTLMLLQCIAQKGDKNILSEFNFSIAFPSNFPQLPDAPLLKQSENCSFVSQTMLLLNEGLNSLPENLELCQRCMDLLRLLTGDEKFLERKTLKQETKTFSNIIAPIICHSICNNLGVPSIDEVDLFEKKIRILLYFLHFIGFLSWFLLRPIILSSGIDLIFSYLKNKIKYLEYLLI